MMSVVALEVAAAPGSRRFRLLGELTASTVDEVAANLGLTEMPCDILLDLRDLTFREGSAVTLFSRIAGHLAGRGRLYVLFPSTPVLRLLADARLEQELLNLRIIRHPSWAPDRRPHVGRLPRG